MIESFNIRVSPLSRNVFSAIAENDNRTIKNIFGQTQQEAMTMAKLAILKLAITTKTIPLILYQEDVGYILAVNLSAKKLLNLKKDSVRAVNLLNGCLIKRQSLSDYRFIQRERYLIPNPIQVLQIESTTIAHQDHFHRSIQGQA